jgi:hypothetical protein
VDDVVVTQEGWMADYQQEVVEEVIMVVEVNQECLEIKEYE